MLKNKQMKKKISVILVDDHKMFRDGLKSLLMGEEIADVIGEASTGREFLDLIEQNIPDLVLMDIEMPELNGIEATKIATEKYPGLKILALSMFGDETYYLNMINAGAKGFVLKTSGIDELKKAILDVEGGECYFSSELLRQIILKMEKDHGDTKTKNSSENMLSKRELEVLEQICIGLSTNEIAEKLFLSPTTVKGYRTNILSKTGCNNTANLVMYSIKNKLVDIL